MLINEKGGQWIDKERRMVYWYISKRENKMKSSRIRLFYNVVFLMLEPIATMVMLYMSSLNSDEFGDFLIINILPFFLIIWFAALAISIAITTMRCKKTHKDIKINIVLFYCISTALLLMCSFVLLFTKSLLLGGFHASWLSWNKNEGGSENE